MKTPKSSNKVWIWALLFIAILAVAATVIYHNREKIPRLFNSEKSTELQKTDIAEDYVPTIQETLQMREQMKWNQHVDSVFLTMPEVVLTDILINHGTSMSIEDIVTIYESNKNCYNSVLSGARSQQYIDSINEKREERDTISISHQRNLLIS